ncbi:MAG: LPS export ABC transporter permease LptF [Desulfobacula sp.]|nr:LPS export ABC transporter permease LptF [Desulfobacula sp.]
MKSINIVNKYIFRELVFPFLNCLFFLTFVFLMTRIPEIANMVMNYNVQISSILIMIVFTLPRFLEFTIPMSVTISILLTIMRMSGENEILALKAAGVSLYKLLPPVLVFCLMGTILTLWMTLFALPWANLSIRLKKIEFAQSGIDMALQERQFNYQIDNLMIYVSHADIKTHTLKDILIEDRRTKGVVSISAAPSGELIHNKNKMVYTLRLYNGIINQVNFEQGSVNNIQFENYDITIDLTAMNRAGGKITKEFDEINPIELIRRIRTGIKDKTSLNEALMELNEKFSVPFACLSLGLLAFSLGIQSTSLKRSSGFSMGLLFFLLYYFLLAAGWSAGETGAYPPFLGMWMPNMVLGSAGIYLLIRNAKDKPVRMPQFVVNHASALKRRLLRSV